MAAWVPCICTNDVPKASWTIANDLPRYQASYLAMLKDLRDTDPAARATIDAVNDLVSGGALYKALKEIGKLTKREEELLAA